jgi:hypothetical protein
MVHSFHRGDNFITGVFMSKLMPVIGNLLIFSTFKEKGGWNSKITHNAKTGPQRPNCFTSKIIM